MGRSGVKKICSTPLYASSRPCSRCSLLARQADRQAVEDDIGHKTLSSRQSFFKISCLH